MSRRAAATAHRARRRAWLAGVACALAAMVACSNEDTAPAVAGAGGASQSSANGGGGAGGSGGMPEPLTPCQERALAICTKVAECGEVFLTVTSGDVTRCSHRQTLACEFEKSLPGSGLDDDEVAACAAAAEGASCSAFAADTAACAPSGGSEPDGADCVSGWQCQSGHCAQTEANGCGTCVTAAAPGASCAGGEACPAAHHCDAAQVCSPLAPAGASCAEGQACEVFLQCHTGVCDLGGQIGSSCGDGMPCDFVDAGNVCAEGMCAAVLLVGAGDPCGVVEGATAVCTGGAICSPTSSTCLPPAEDGGSCGGNLTCYGPSLCIDGTCQLPDPALCGVGQGGAGGSRGAAGTGGAGGGA